MTQLTAQRNEQAQLIAETSRRRVSTLRRRFLEAAVESGRPAALRPYAAVSPLLFCGAHRRNHCVPADDARNRREYRSNTHARSGTRRTGTASSTRSARNCCRNAKAASNCSCRSATRCKGKSQERSRLTEDRERLEKLIAELNRRAQRPAARRSRATKANCRGRRKANSRTASANSGPMDLLTWQGVFIAAPEGTPVTAVAAGTRRIFGLAARFRSHGDHRSRQRLHESLRSLGRAL